MLTTKALYPILIKLNKIIEDLKNKGQDTGHYLFILNRLFAELIHKNLFNEECLLKLELQQREWALEAVRPFIDYEDFFAQNLYKKFASHQTKKALVQDFLDDISHRRDDVIELYNNWSVELRKSVNLENSQEKDDFYRLLTQLICFSYMDGHAQD